MLVMGHRQPAISFGITIYTTCGSSRKFFPLPPFFFFPHDENIPLSTATIINIRMRPEYPSNLGNIIFPYFLLFMVCTYLLINLSSPFLYFSWRNRSFINSREKNRKKRWNLDTILLVVEEPRSLPVWFLEDQNPPWELQFSATPTRRRVITVVGRILFPPVAANG